MTLKKMYTNIPVVDTESLLVELPETTDTTKKIRHLEEKVRLLSEQVHQISSALALNSRQIRRQNTDIHNVTTVLRSHK